MTSRRAFIPRATCSGPPSDDVAAALVGSSNLSRSGLVDGIEWNVGLQAVAPMLRRFAELWTDPRSAELTAEWLRTYHPPPVDTTLAPVVELDEAPVQPVQPRPIQREALTALEQTRLAGHRAGLVVMATGLGKTWLAAFDTARPQFGRVLFVAHREEILRQSRDVFRQVQPDARPRPVLRRREAARRAVRLRERSDARRQARVVRADAFDYIVIDEFHHAAAPLVPTGHRPLRAQVPARADRDARSHGRRRPAGALRRQPGVRVRSGRGHPAEELVPFRYWGVPDSVDFEPIPWRNGRFEPEMLAQAVETQERAQRALEEWSDRRGRRTLAFCVSTSHADFMAALFEAHGVRAAAVHSGPTSAPRHASLDELRDGRARGRLRRRPLQRGPRRAARRHRADAAADRVAGRVPAAARSRSSHVAGQGTPGRRRLHRQPPQLPAQAADAAEPWPAHGAVDRRRGRGSRDGRIRPSARLLRGLPARGRRHASATLAARGRAAIEEYCRSYYEEEGVRPSAAQTFHAGYNPASVRARHGGWFGFLRDLGLASDREAESSRLPETY